MILPELIAHRGYARHYPENSLIGIRAAIDAGARYVEVDVQLTADQIPVLFHDRDLERICGIAGEINTRTLAQLQQLHAYEPGRFGYRFAQNPIATLADFCSLLQQHPGVTAFVEVKPISVGRFGSISVAQAVMPLLRPVARQCVLISYTLDFLHTARRNGWHKLGVIIRQWRELKKGLVREIDPQYIFINYKRLPRWRSIRQEQRKLAVYEVADPKLALKLQRRGVNMIETFAIGEMLQQFELLRGAEG